MYNKYMKKKRKINWFHVFILLIPFIIIGSVFVFIFARKEEPKQFTYLNTICLPEATETPNIKEFTNNILSKIAKLEEKQSSVLYLGEFLITAYDDCYECQEEFIGTTALGVAPQVNHTIAVDPNIIPLGSHVIINGIEYVAEDVGGGINNYHIDIFVGSHAETYSDNYNGYFDVYLVR